MSAAPERRHDAANARLDSALRLVSADPPLAALNARAGGGEGAPLAVPQIAALARLAQRLGIAISRAAIAADGDEDVDLWVSARPDDGEIALSVSGWTRRPAAVLGANAAREADCLRAGADWTFECDEGLRLTAIARAGAAALGRPASALKDRPLTEILRFRDGGEGGMPILAALAAHDGFEGQEADAGDGARYRLSGVPLIDGMGRFAGFRGVAVTATPEPPAEAPPAETSDGDAFGARLDAALRGPLDHIIANAETLRACEDGPLPDTYVRYAGDIAAAGRHLLALVDDLVDLQAIERPGFRPGSEPIDLADIGRRAAGLLAVRAANASARIDGPADDEAAPARGDFRRTLQIVMNLLTNAIRYSPEGAAVWIRTEMEGDLACLIVADQGKGIAPEDQARIFEKFGRVDESEPGGTGLGLYIARRLARAMGGDLSVDSAPGRGARFTLTLPV